MEAVAPQAEPCAPGGGQRVGRGGLRQVRVERGVETGDRGDIRQQGAHGVDGCERACLVYWRKVSELGKRRDNAVVDQDRGGEAVATVYHPVADGTGIGGAAEAINECDKFLARRLAVPWLHVQRRFDAVTRAEQAQLQAARTGVNDQDAHQDRSATVTRLASVLPASSPRHGTGGTCRVHPRRPHHIWSPSPDSARAR